MGNGAKLRHLLLRYLLYDALLRPGAWTQAVANDRERVAAWVRAILAVLLSAPRAANSTGPTEEREELGEGGGIEEEPGKEPADVVFLGGAGVLPCVLAARSARLEAGSCACASLPLYYPPHTAVHSLSLPCQLLSPLLHWDSGTELPVIPVAFARALVNASCIDSVIQEMEGKLANVTACLVEPIKPVAAAATECVLDNGMQEKLRVFHSIQEVRGESARGRGEVDREVGRPGKY